MKHINIKAIITMFVSMAYMTAFAYDAEIDGIYYNFSDNGATITYGEAVYSGDIVIPDEVSYQGNTYNVTCVGESAFYDCYELTGVTIGSNIRRMDFFAFYDCNCTRRLCGRIPCR